ncbi:MAG: DUF504 domain-containing protein [Thermoplasmatota archaeon]|jgi:uncharacterized protein (UPF0248 family)
MTNPKEILNKLKWDQKYSLELAEIWYKHRGAPKDTKIIFGKDIIKLEKSFFETREAMIPYHRIFKIIYDNKIIFER